LPPLPPQPSNHDGVLHPVCVVAIGEILVRVGAAAFLAGVGTFDRADRLAHQIVEFERFDEVGVPDQAAVADRDVLHPLVLTFCISSQPSAISSRCRGTRRRASASSAASAGGLRRSANHPWHCGNGRDARARDRPNPWAAAVAAVGLDVSLRCRPVARPNTTRSISEFEPRRFAPWTETQAASPTA
jgi:hypothetical protein